MDFRHISVGCVFYPSDYFGLKKLPFFNEFENTLRVGPRDIRQALGVPGLSRGSWS